MHFKPVKVSFNGFAILFKILSAHCVESQKMEYLPLHFLKLSRPDIQRLLTWPLFLCIQKEGNTIEVGQISLETIACSIFLKKIEFEVLSISK